MTAGPAQRTAVRPDLDRLARGAVLTLAGSAVSALATFGFTVVVTRGSSPEQAGIFFALTGLFVMCGALARLGVPVGLVYFLSRQRTTGDEHLMRAVVRHAAGTVTALAVGLGLVGVAAAGPLAEALVGTRGGGSTALLRWLSAGLVFAALTDVGIATTRGLGALRPLVLVDRIGRPVAQLLLAVGVVLAGLHSALALGLAWVLPWVPCAVLVLLWADRLRTGVERRSGRTGSTALAPGQRAAFWRFTAPRSIGSIAQLALQRSDIVLVGALRGPRDAAIYTAATRFLVFGQLGASSITTTIQPTLAQLLVQDDRSGARSVYRVATVWLVLLAWPVYLLSAVFAEQLLAVFGSEYRIGSGVIVVLSLVMLVATASGPVDVVLTMAGRSSWTMANSLAALTANVALNLLLIPRVGILGAALAWAVAIALNNLVPLAQLAVSMRLHPFGRSSGLAAALAAGCFGALPLAVRLVLGGGAGVAVGTAAACTCLYAALLWRWRDRLELDSLLAMRRRGRAGAA